MRERERERESERAEREIEREGGARKKFGTGRNRTLDLTLERQTS